jgi:HlyD family secretion protein
VHAQTNTASFSASGFVEAEEIAIAPEIAGRVVELPLDEGDTAQKGTVLLRLEDDVLSAQVELARGKLEEAQAILARVKNGARIQTIDKAAAQVVLAQAACDAARQAWLDANAVRDNPQALDVQISGARAQVAVTQQKLEASLVQRDMAETAWKDYGEGVDKLADVPLMFRPSMPVDFYLIPYQWEQALAGANAARAAYDGARAALDHLLSQRSNPQKAQAQVDAAYAHYQASEAAVAQAQAGLDGMKAGATPEQIAAARAQVEVAQAALEAAQVQLDKSVIRSPGYGVIVARSVHVGEFAAPGMTAMVLADLDNVTLMIYIPGARLGEISLGQAVNVKVDAFSDKNFPGVIIRIADEAEFTPRSVRTPEDRASLVYAVKIKIANADHELKPGMQAEAKVGQ